MLEIKELTKYYGKNLAVDQVTFTVPNGQVGVLLGPNGSGKSTIIKSIAGLLRYQGEIRIKGIPARQIPAKRKFAYVPEIPNMFDALTVREHIEYVRMAYDSEITDEEIEKILKAFEMDDKQDKLGNELSKGMMQKVSICCALAVKPEVILLDEPMVGLDPAAIKMLKAEGIPTLGTAVYGAAQGMLSALAGAEYVAPYVNRVDAQGGDGIQTVVELQQLLTLHAPQSKVLAASFKTPRQALDCLLAGCESITLPLDVAQQFITSPAVDAAIVKFEQDWQGAFGRTSI